MRIVLTIAAIAALVAFVGLGAAPGPVASDLPHGTYLTDEISIPSISKNTDRIFLAQGDDDEEEAENGDEEKEEEEAPGLDRTWNVVQYA